MTELHRESDKLNSDVKHLMQALKAGNADLALAAAKRARRHATIVTRQLAAERDKLQSDGGHKQHGNQD